MSTPIQNHNNTEFDREEIKRKITPASAADQTTLVSIFDKVAAAIRAKHL